MIGRIIGVLLLRPRVFRNIGVDPNATGQAVSIVAIVGLISAVSAAVSAVIWGVGFTAVNTGLTLIDTTIAEIGLRLPVLDGPVAAFTNALVGAFISWILWAVITWLMGEYLFGGDTGFTEMARIIGYAKAPQFLAGLGFIPGIGWLPRLIGWGWMVVATFIGVREGLEISSGKTILTIVLSAIAVALVNWYIVGPLIAAVSS